jgi:thioredoxin-like negative regulator of GroEL
MRRRVTDEGLYHFVVEGHGYSVVLFFDYCSVPCDTFRPDWNALSEMLDLPFYELEACENPGITEELGIRVMPTTALFLNGKVIRVFEGPWKKEILVQRLKEELSKAR